MFLFHLDQIRNLSQKKLATCPKNSTYIERGNRENGVDAIFQFSKISKKGRTEVEARLSAKERKKERKEESERKGKAEKQRRKNRVCIVPDAIGLLIKGISCCGSGSRAEDLFHRVLMPAESGVQEEKYPGARGKEGQIVPMLLTIDF